jgi:hypothetical protein
MLGTVLARRAFHAMREECKYDGGDTPKLSQHASYRYLGMDAGPCVWQAKATKPGSPGSSHHR